MQRRKQQAEDAVLGYSSLVKQETAPNPGTDYAKDFNGHMQKCNLSEGWLRAPRFPTPPKKKKPPKNRRLRDGAGEEGRTPDLMLGKHTL